MQPSSLVIYKEQLPNECLVALCAEQWGCKIRPLSEPIDTIPPGSHCVFLSNYWSQDEMAPLFKKGTTVTTIPGTPAFLAIPLAKEIMGSWLYFSEPNTIAWFAYGYCKDAADYRYFEEPDLPLIEISPELIERAQDDLPELPAATFERLMKENGLSDYEAGIIVDDLELSKYYEQAAAVNKSKQVVNWILRDVLGYLKEHKLKLAALKVTPEKLAKIVELLESDTINNKAAKEVFETVAQTGDEPEAVVESKGLKAIGSESELEAIVVEIIKANPKVVEDYKSGKDRLFGFFVGQSMKKTQGKGNPKILTKLLKKHLG